MKVFLDVGAHAGQTLDEVTKWGYGFDLILAFEPMPREFARLERKYRHHPTVALQPYGLGSTTGPRMMYGSNDRMEASVLPDMEEVDASIATTCHFERASDIVKWYGGDTVIMKLNVEGAEIEILNDLIDSGEIWKLDEILIDFDIIHTPTGPEEIRAMLAKLHDIRYVTYTLSGEVLRASPLYPDDLDDETHQEYTARWLTMAGFGRDHS